MIQLGINYGIMWDVSYPGYGGLQSMYVQFFCHEYA